MSVVVWLYHGLAWTWGGYRLRSAAAGYNILSGDVGDLTLLGGAFALLRHRNCHVRGCWRLGHIDPATHHPACRQHHTHAHKLGRAPLR